MASKTIAIGIGSTSTLTFDINVAVGLGYKSILVNPITGEETANPLTPSLFVREDARKRYQEAYRAGLVKPAVETARLTAEANAIIIT